MHPPAHALYMNQSLKYDFTVKEDAAVTLPAPKNAQPT